MRYFPFFFDLKGAPALVVGGGAVAARKTDLLLRAGAIVRVVAPQILPRLAQQVQNSGGQVRNRPYRKTDLIRQRIAVAAAGIPKLNRRIRQDASNANIPLNVVDQPRLCDFIFPAFADRNPVCVAVSSGGASPVLARFLRNQLESDLPQNLGHLANFCEKHRHEVQNQLPEKMRRHFWESILNQSPAMSALLNGDSGQADQLLQQELNRFAADSDSQPKGEVFVIGAGPGDPELMTIKARRLLQKADAVFYDRLVARDILNLARRDADKIFVGKTRARKTFSQDEINNALIQRAQSGDIVARLKGGDPFIFGRGGEECAALAQAGIPFQVVPGVSAANGCAAAAGIPLTHRGTARAVRIETAYREDMMSPKRWQRLAQDEESTLVFYMAGASLSAVADNLALGGKSPNTPAAVICGGATSAQKVIRGTLANIAQRANGKIFSPALIVIGDVAGQSLFQTDNQNESAPFPFSQIA